MAGLSFDNVPAKRGGALSFEDLPDPNRIISRGSILPFSKQADGDVEFDSNAGLVGALKRAFMLPGEVAAGEVDPMSEEGLDRAAEMAAAVSPVNPAIRAGGRAIAGPSQALRRPNVKAPTAEELRLEGKRQYDAVRDAGVEYTVESVDDVVRAARQDLENEGFRKSGAPKTFSLFREFDRQFASPPDGASVPIASIAAERKAYGKVKPDKLNNDYTDYAAAQTVRQRLADFLTRPDQTSLVDRTPAGLERARRAGQLQRTADGNYGAYKRSKTLTDLGDSAELDAAVANSGQNLDNATRRNLKNLIKNPDRSRPFTDQERAGIEKVARGTKGRNFLRGAGNVLGGGGGLGMMLTGSIGGGAGAMAGGPVGAAIGAAIPAMTGAAMKGGAARLTQRGLRKIDEATRKRSPLYEERVRKMPMEAIAPDRRAALIRALILQAEQAQQAE